MFDAKYWEDKKQKKVEEFEKLKDKALGKFLDLANDFSREQLKLTQDYNDILKVIADAPENKADEASKEAVEEPTAPEKTE